MVVLCKVTLFERRKLRTYQKVSWTDRESTYRNQPKKIVIWLDKTFDKKAAADKDLPSMLLCGGIRRVYPDIHQDRLCKCKSSCGLSRHYATPRNLLTIYY